MYIPTFPYSATKRILNPNPIIGRHKITGQTQLMDQITDQIADHVDIQPYIKSQLKSHSKSRTK